MDTISLSEAKEIMGSNFIGADELIPFFSFIGEIPKIVDSPIPFTSQILRESSKDHVLVLGVSEAMSGWKCNILNLRTKFGLDPVISEPCFYNQDWYLNEEFVKSDFKAGWYLIKKQVDESSRSVLPDSLENDRCFKFPTAVLCTYVFFAYYFHAKSYLWEYDFVWCIDHDFHGDRIYVGKYADVTGINKNGFSIHRHLSLKPWHAAISIK
jgi:hypothetical protein